MQPYQLDSVQSLLCDGSTYRRLPRLVSDDFTIEFDVLINSTGGSCGERSANAERGSPSRQRAPSRQRRSPALPPPEIQPARPSWPTRPRRCSRAR